MMTKEYTYFRNAQDRWMIKGPGLNDGFLMFDANEEEVAKEVCLGLNIAFTHGKGEKAKEIRNALCIVNDVFGFRVVKDG